MRKNSARVRLEGGQIRKVNYCAGLIRYFPRKISATETHVAHCLIYGISFTRL